MTKTCRSGGLLSPYVAPVFMVHRSNHSPCFKRNGMSACGPKLRVENRQLGSCDQGPIQVSICSPRFARREKASRSLDAYSSNQPPNDKTGTETLPIRSRILVFFQKASREG